MKSNAEHSYELLRVSRDVFSLDPIKRASYRNAGKGAFDIQLENGIIIVNLIAKEILGDETLRLIREKFLTEVLDEDLRKIVRDETTDVRNLILAHAFSKSNLIM